MTFRFSGNDRPLTPLFCPSDSITAVRPSANPPQVSLEDRVPEQRIDGIVAFSQCLVLKKYMDLTMTHAADPNGVLPAAGTRHKVVGPKD
jgi:hypothetical protein